MATKNLGQTQENESQTKEQTPVLEVKEFVKAQEPEKPLPELKRGEVLVAEVDENGKELNFFVSNQKTFDDFYSKNKKFKLKKK